jgi:hypothetical protein
LGADGRSGLTGALIVRLARFLVLLASADARAALVGVLAEAAYVHAAEVIGRDLLFVLPLLALLVLALSG